MPGTSWDGTKAQVFDYIWSALGMKSGGWSFWLNSGPAWIRIIGSQRLARFRFCSGDFLSLPEYRVESDLVRRLLSSPR